MKQEDARDYFFRRIMPLGESPSGTPPLPKQQIHVLDAYQG